MWCKNLILLFFIFVLFPSVTATVSLEINMPDHAAQNQFFPGNVSIKYDTAIPQNSFLNAFIDYSSSPVSTLSLTNYLQNIIYEYKNFSFTYNITAHGKTESIEYPDQEFYFILRARGTCGNEQCATTGSCDCFNLCTPPATPPYTCEWSITEQTSHGPETVNKGEGLKYIYNGEDAINIPPDANEVYWNEMFSHPNVETTMREACGNENYQGRSVFPDGWVRRNLDNFEACGPFCKKAIIEKFDETSLSENRQNYIDRPCEGNICGGVYKRNKETGEIQLLHYPDEVEWNGTTGEIKIYNYRSEYEYMVTYLPPNGPRLCAYAPQEESHTETWTKTTAQTGLISYTQPFSKTYTESELPYQYTQINTPHAIIKPPECPENSVVCNQTVSYYSVSTENPYITVDFDENTRTVTATTTVQKLDKNYTLSIPLSDFPNLVTPDETGDHTLKINLQYGTSTVAETQTSFSVCADHDHDGFCNIDDCNDTNPSIHPDANELCDSLDNDCDGKTDEDFPELGNPCGLGVCKGIYVCSSDKTTTTCSGFSSKQKEICSNSLDDDCDGIVDELYEELPDGRIVSGCMCREGDRKPCGSNVGRCREGYRVCINGEWSRECLDKTGPFTEVCNGEDDDCDGIIDNIDGKTSVQETKCQCYNGNPPKTEICNDIDDDCDGETDEGLSCCRDGDERACGSNTGICSPGIEKCVNGKWSGVCENSYGPDPRGEICWDNLDNDCDGQTDENCDLEITCNNGYKDVNEEGVDCGGECPRKCGINLSWILFSIGVILLIISIMLAEFKGKL